MYTIIFDGGRRLLLVCSDEAVLYALPSPEDVPEDSSAPALERIADIRQPWGLTSDGDPRRLLHPVTIAERDPRDTNASSLFSVLGRTDDEVYHAGESYTTIIHAFLSFSTTTSKPAFS